MIAFLYSLSILGPSIYFIYLYVNATITHENYLSYLSMFMSCLLLNVEHFIRLVLNIVYIIKTKKINKFCRNHMFLELVSFVNFFVQIIMAMFIDLYNPMFMHFIIFVCSVILTYVVKWITLLAILRSTEYREVEPNLEIVVLGHSVTIEDDSSCAICLEITGDMIIALSCGHHFHQQCIVDWYRIKNSCPICRSSIPPSSQDNEESSEDND